jgi:hypothetical protein
VIELNEDNWVDLLEGNWMVELWVNFQFQIDSCIGILNNLNKEEIQCSKIDFSDKIH